MRIRGGTEFSLNYERGGVDNQREEHDLIYEDIYWSSALIQTGFTLELI